MSEWADRYFELSGESSTEHGKWLSLPFQRGIMDAFSDPSLKYVTVKKSARVGYTKMLCAFIGYSMQYDVRSTLVVQPTDEDAEGFSKDDIAPMLRDVPVLRGLVTEAKKSNSNNTIKKKSYPGGTLSIVGGTSPRNFRRITVDNVILDEWDGYPPMAGKEGDQGKLADKRATTSPFPKHIRGSTPAMLSASRIVPDFMRSDRRRYFLPCPHCNWFQTLRFENLWWDKDEDSQGNKIHCAETAAFTCEKCGALMEEARKQDMLEAGKWRAEVPTKDHAGFEIWTAYSPFPGASWKNIVEEFLEAKHDPDPLRAKMRVFVNTVLGDAYDDKKEEATRDHSDLMDRREPYDFGTVPSGGCYLLATVDTQNDRLEVKVKAWGPAGPSGEHEEGWVVDVEVINGDPNHASTNEKPSVWDRLDTFLAGEYTHDSGAKLKIQAAAIDTGGGRTKAVYEYCARKSHPCPVIPIKGANAIDAPLVPTDAKGRVKATVRQLKSGRRINLIMVGVHQAKNEVDANLSVTDPGPGFMHFSQECDEEYFKQITAEVKDWRHSAGVEYYVWKKIRPNEKLDLEAYQLFLLRFMQIASGLDLKKEAAKIEAYVPATETTVGKPEPKESRARRVRNNKARWR